MSLALEIQRAISGPFLEAVRSAQPNAEPRPGQEALMVSLAKCLDTDPKEVCSQQGKERRAVHYTAEIGTGIGKTYAILALATIVAATAGRRTIIGTHTRALRDDIDRQGRKFVAAFSAAMGYRDVSIGAIRPLSSACSPALADHYADDLSSQDRSEAQAYRKWVYERYEAGDIPTPQDWLAEGRHIDFVIASKPSEAADKLSVRSGDLARLAKHPIPYIAQTINNALSANLEARDFADIIIVTHALVMRNGIDFGQTLCTSTRDNNRHEGTTDRFDLVLDEADSYINQADLSGSETLSVAELEAVLGARAVSPIKTMLSSAIGRRDRVTIETDTQLAAVSDALRGKPKNGPLAKLEAIGLDHSDLMRAHRAQQLIGRIATLTSIHEQAGNGHGHIHSDAGYKIWVERQGNSFVIGMDAMSPSKLLNRSWVNNNLHAFDHVIHLSGTLVDLPTGYSTKVSYYHGDVGVNGMRDAVHQEAGHQPHEVIPADSRPLVQLDLTQGNLRPIASDKMSLSSAYWQRIADLITSYRTQDQRQRLILCQSHAAMALLGDLIATKGREVIIQDNYSIDALNALLATRKREGRETLVLSLKWQGMNYVQDGITLIDHIIIPQMPIRPPGKLYPKKMTLERTAWKMRNGIGRMYRNSGDAGRLSILDPRFIVPKQIAAQQADAIQRNRYEPVARSILGIGKSQSQVDSQTIITIESMSEPNKQSCAA